MPKETKLIDVSYSYRVYEDVLLEVSADLDLSDEEALLELVGLIGEAGETYASEPSIDWVEEVEG